MELQCWKMRTTSSAGKEAMVHGDSAMARAPGRMTWWMTEVVVERMGTKSLRAPSGVYYLSICNRGVGREAEMGSPDGSERAHHAVLVLCILAVGAQDPSLMLSQNQGFRWWTVRSISGLESR